MSAKKAKGMSGSKSGGKSADRDRRTRVEAMRREQQARERRKNTAFVVLAVIVGVGIIVAAALPAVLKNRNDPADKALSSFGVSTAAAACAPVTSEKPSGNLVHEPDGTVIDYDQVPPSSGPHWAVPVLGSRAFYTTKDRPEMEQLVHNLEHGYTILWYDDTIKPAQLDTLEDLAESARSQDAVGPAKFIVSAWDDSYGDFPAGKHIALSHWGAQTAHRQLCGDVSGQVVQRFIDRFPFRDSPEPAGA